MCNCVLTPGDNPIAVNKYIISYHKIKDIKFDLLKSVNSISNNIPYNYRIIFQNLTGKDTEGADTTKSEVMFQYMSAGNEKDTKGFRSTSPSLG